MGTVIQMLAVSTGGTESALASIDVPMNGNLIGVEWALGTDMDTDNDSQVFQLSFGSTYSGANDARQVISNASLGVLTFTAGQAVIGGSNIFIQLPDIPVGMGERLYIHSAASAAVVGTARACLHFDFDIDKVQTRRR